ncbi:hypothetical protein BBP40_010168 [Aspergillus hancockii]|nr:hypothetical protein BBP40_010168 [Aspergillus hancockii]
MPIPNIPLANTGNIRTSWQDQLKNHCRGQKWQDPVFNIYTERRGGRTAWTCSVCVQGKPYPAQFWYDGDYINNAKEDAAEKALNVLKPQPSRHASFPGFIQDPLFPQASAYARR